VWACLRSVSTQLCQSAVAAAASVEFCRRSLLARGLPNRFPMFLPKTSGFDSARRPATPGCVDGKADAPPVPVILIATPITTRRALWRAGGEGFGIVEVADYAQLVRVMGQLKPTVLLLDHRLPGMAGMGSMASLRCLWPSAKIVVLASPPDEREAIAALTLGARGYCEGTIAPALLGKALGAVQRGEIWIGRKLITCLLEELSAVAEQRPERHALPDRLEDLTPRERDVADRLGGGASNKEIAHALGVAEGTVKAHLTAIFRKLGTRSRLETAIVVTDRSSRYQRSRPTTHKVDIALLAECARSPGMRLRVRS